MVTNVQSKLGYQRGALTALISSFWRGYRVYQTQYYGDYEPGKLGCLK